MILSVDEAAEKLKVGPEAIRIAIRTKKLKAYKVGKLWRIYDDDLDAYIRTKSNLGEE